jgi:hypothetical protein
MTQLNFVATLEHNVEIDKTMNNTIKLSGTAVNRSPLSEVSQN